MKSPFLRIALAAVIGFGLACSAAAQDRAPPGARGADRQRLFEDMQHRREQRLHDLLQIKPDQEAAFRAFAGAVEQARAQRGPEPDAPSTALTTPERLDRAARRLAGAQARLQKTSAAVKTFYAVLTPDQRKAFDALPLRFGFGRRAMLMRGRFDGPPPPVR
jgi:hypothetical protein